MKIQRLKGGKGTQNECISLSFFEVNHYVPLLFEVISSGVICFMLTACACVYVCVWIILRVIVKIYLQTFIHTNNAS